MGQQEFDLLLQNVEKMTNVVKDLPENLHDMVYSSLVAALLEGSKASTSGSPNVLSNIEVESDVSESILERNIAQELEECYRRYSLDSVNDMEFAAFVAYFFAKLAPRDEMTDRIDESHYKKACLISGRKLPKRISGSMNNAKNLKDYLEQHGPGTYSISDIGEHFVKHTLLKENVE